MLINKPQFDLTKIKQGQVYWLKKIGHNRRTIINAPCIIMKTKPLEIEAKYYLEGDFEISSSTCMSSIIITIDEVVDLKITLEKMIIEPKLEETKDVF